MTDRFARLEMIAGKDAMAILKKSRVAVFGIGGVGSYAAEGLARSGIGTLALIDHDTVDITNLNRQIIALESTLGRAKVDAAKERLMEINPEITVHTFQKFYLPEDRDWFDFTSYDYIIDAIDTVTAKIDLILEAQRAGVPIISSMGTGNRMDPTKIGITDVYRTAGDPLAKIMRHELKKRGVRKLTVCTSAELPLKPIREEEAYQNEMSRSGRRGLPGSSPFVPPAAGLAIASYVVRQLIRKQEISE